MAVVAIFGATASGKSALALALAERVGGEIVSADALQLYAGLPLLSNQPSPDDRSRVPHHLVAVWPLEEQGDVARYAALAHRAVDDVLARGRVPIVVGGTGLYLRAAIADVALPPQPPAGLRERLVAEYDRLGAGASHARLAAVDARAAAAVHPNDRRRVVRALELHALGASLQPERDALWATETRHPTVHVALDVPREELHRRIAERTRRMLDGGAIEEVRAVLATRRPSATAAATLGLDEIGALLDGRVDRPTCERRLVERTRSYARRQEIWSRRLPGPVRLDGTAAPGENAARLADLLPA